MNNNDIMKDIGIEVILKTPQDFLLVKETLTRIGIAAKKTNTLFQSAHILFKHGVYYIVHFKEMFKLDGKSSDISEDDIARRNLICKLLEDWKLLEVVNKDDIAKYASISTIKVINFKDKDLWQLVPKYNIGSPRNADNFGNR